MIAPWMYLKVDWGPAWEVMKSRVSRTCSGVPLVVLTIVLPEKEDGGMVRRVSSTEVFSSRQMMIRVLASKHAAGAEAMTAPLSVRGFALDAVLFQTVVLYPALRNADARADPMAPRPRRLTLRSMLNGKYGFVSEMDRMVVSSC